MLASPAPRDIPTRSGPAWRLPLAVAALLAVGAGAGVLIGRHSAAPATEPPAAVAPEALAAPPSQTKGARGAAGTSADAAKAKAKPAPHPSAAADRPPAGAGARAPLDTRPAGDVAVCARCGVVESVHTETRPGDGSGVGAVAGGVVGGLLGNQMGKGNGRAAMTVIGAIGGGVAGNAIEKHQRASTVHVVRVRMDDGTLRSFTRSEPWAVGQRVTVDGSTLQVSADTAPARKPLLQAADKGLAS